MTSIDDGLLMAYADGELPEEEAARIERLLARDAAARERVRLYRESAALARAAFASTLAEPVPAALEARVRRLARERATDRVVPFPESRPGAGRWNLRRMALPLAASLALVIGFLAGSRMGPEDGEAVLARALETTPSGVVGPGEVLPLLTLRRADGSWCRRFEQPRGARMVTGTACRQPDGRWRVVVLVEEAPQGTDGYRPAGASENPLASLEARMGMRAVDEATEEGLIASGWQVLSR